MDHLAFEKKLFVSESLYGDVNAYLRTSEILFKYMQETNSLFGKRCEFFCLKFRPARPDETDQTVFVMELRWGYKDE